jgi:hypothetical protein
MKNGLYTGLFSVPFSYFNGITSNFSNRFYPALPDKDDYKDTPIILEENTNLTEATFLGKSFTITLKKQSNSPIGRSMATNSKAMNNAKS